MTAPSRHRPRPRRAPAASGVALAAAVTMLLSACTSTTTRAPSGGASAGSTVPTDTVASPTDTVASPTEPAPPGGTTSPGAASSSAASTGAASTGAASTGAPVTGAPASPAPGEGTSSSHPVRTATDAPIIATTSSSPFSTVTVTGTIATGLTTPWGLGFLPDGTALVTERDTAKLLAIAPDARHTVRTVGTVTGVHPGGEGGLLGLAVAPQPGDPTVFVYFTSGSDNRIAKLTLNSDATAITDQQAVLTGIPKASIHNGGRIAFGPDGDLYIGTGDATNSDRAQQLDYLGGKILRITADGKPAPGNPFHRAPLVYSYGHRNVQGLAFDAQGRLWASEFGQSAYDELNLIKPGGNYGWPIVEGPSDNPKYVAPYKYWPTSDASPSGLAIIGETAFMAALRGTRLWLIPLAGPAGATTPKAQLTGTYGRLRTVIVAPDGSLWLTTSNTDGRGDPQPGDDRILQLRAG